MVGLLANFGQNTVVTLTLLSEPQSDFPAEIKEVAAGKIRVRVNARLSAGSPVKIENNGVIALGEVVFSAEHAETIFADVLVQDIVQRRTEPRTEPAALTQPRALSIAQQISDKIHQTLSAIPSTFGRLLHVVGARWAEHLLLSQPDTALVLGRIHQEVFADWLNLDLRHQKADIDECLASLKTPQEFALRDWLASGNFCALIPPEALSPERELSLLDSTVLIQLLTGRCETCEAARRGTQCSHCRFAGQLQCWSALVAVAPATGA
jgi:hypothetical protein